MKQLSILLIVSCFTAIIGCKKEIVATSTNDKVPETISMASVTSDQLLSDGTQFGIAGLDGLKTDEKITLMNELGVKYVRARIILKDFRGNVGGLTQLADQGFKVILNLNWDRIDEVRGDRIPNPWPKDMDTYRAKLEEVLSVFKPEVAVIENEPTNDLFHSGPIEDYITELTNAVDVCKKYGVKVADGCVHVPLVQQVRRGGNLSGNSLEVKKLIDAYKTLDLDYVNVHDHGEGNSYPSGAFESVADYLREQTGKSVMCNEFSLGTSSNSLLEDMVNGLKQGDYKIALAYSGDGGRSVSLNSGTNLLSLGIYYSLLLIQLL